MRAFPRRLIALFVLVSFGPLATGGQGWHCFTEDCICSAERCGGTTNGCGATACAGSAHGHCDGGHSACNHHHAKRRVVRNPSQPTVNRPGHNHDQCLICQFFAQPQQSTPV